METDPAVVVMSKRYNPEDKLETYNRDVLAFFKTKFPSTSNNFIETTSIFDGILTVTISFVGFG